MDVIEPTRPGRTRKRFLLQRGLYTLRYEQAEDSLFPPGIYVSSAEPTIEFIWPPGTTTNALHRPGTGMVVRAEQPGVLVIDVVASVYQGSTDAEIRFEGLNEDADVELSTPNAKTTVAQTKPYNALIKGHLASIGDVTSEGNDWLAGPDAPSRIEAIAITLRGLPANAMLVYGARTARQPLNQGIKLAEAGHWVGSKGRGEPLVALRLELRYTGMPTHQLSGEAMFLGSVPRPFEGLAIDLQGLSGREPLIGLKLDLVPIPVEMRAAFAKRAEDARQVRPVSSPPMQAARPAPAPVAHLPRTASDGVDLPSSVKVTKAPPRPASQQPPPQSRQSLPPPAVAAAAAGNQPEQLKAKRVRVFRA